MSEVFDFKQFIEAGKGKITEEKYGDSYGEKFRQYEDKIKELEKQLTKAKEIIRDLLSCLYSVEYDCVSDLEEAEQFLKGCGE